MPKAIKIKKYKVKKLKNGGPPEGDPKKSETSTPTQAFGGFPLYRQFRDDGTSFITPSPSSGNYVKISDEEMKGLYPGIPQLLEAAEIP